MPTWEDLVAATEARWAASTYSRTRKHLTPDMVRGGLMRVARGAGEHNIDYSKDAMDEARKILECRW